MATFDIALLEKTVSRLSTQPGVTGILIMSAEGVVLRSTLQPDLANQASALAQAVTSTARTAVRELNLVNFGAPPPKEASLPTKKPKEQVEAKADELKVVRIRSKDHEILIAPESEAGRCFTLVVFHRLPTV